MPKPGPYESIACRSAGGHFGSEWRPILNRNQGSGAPSPVSRFVTCGDNVRYFFNLAGVVQSPDNTGIELSSLSDARIHAVKFASEYLRDRPELVWMGEEFRVEVTGETGRTLFTFIAFGVDAPAQEGRLRL